MRQGVQFTTTSWNEQEPPPTMGVREPRRPKPSSDSSGATAQLDFAPEPEAEAVAASARMTQDDA